MNIFAGANPDELLDSLGIRSPTVRAIVTAIVLLGALSAGLKLLLSVVKWFRTKLRQRRADPEELQRLNYRRLFARHVANRIGDLDNKEGWADHRFAELEAEVETVGEDRQVEGFARVLRRRSGLRREKSLSLALRRSRDSLVLLQGDPGSGKSVALRFVTRRMAEEAARAESLDVVIPLYINLKALQPGPVHPQRIHDFVVERLAEGTDRDVQWFLENNFVDGLRRGTWLFLFDSFDEIPEVLSATDADETVHAYSEAIIGFMHGMNQCRGVIASRSFRAPARRDLPRYRIVPLSERRRREVIEKANLAPAERDMLLELPSATPDLITLTENPMFLGLLCEYIRGRLELPAGWHEVFEAYVSHRLGTDADKLGRLFGLDPNELRRCSEDVAFTMTASTGLGLSPTREDLIASYEAANFQGSDRLGVVMDGLEWSKLARSETSGIAGSRPSFTFAHRRFQEYFATCVVLREPDRVAARELLTNGAWRETAVTMFQTQEDRARELIVEAERVVELRSSQLETAPEEQFRWPPGLLHILNLLQNGFAGRTERLPTQLRERIAGILRNAFEHGTITHRKWALEVAGTAPAAELAELLRLGFRGPSAWLRDVASRQAARMNEIPDDLAADIRAGLVLMLSDGRLERDWLETRAQLQRLHPAAPFVQTAGLLRIVPLIDALGLAAMVALAWSLGGGTSAVILAGLAAITAGLTLRGMIAPLAAGVNLRALVRRMYRGGMDFRALWVLGSAYIGVNSRAILVALVADASSAREPRWWLIAVGAYVVSWSLMAVAAGRVGALNHKVFMPFPALVLVVAVLRRVRPGHVILLPKFVVMLLTYIAFIYSLFWLGEHVPTLIISLSIVSGFFTVIIVGRWVVRSARREARDRTWHRRWKQEEHEMLTGEDLLQALSAQQTLAGAERLIRDVRKRRLMIEADDGEAMVRDLLTAIERGPSEDGATWNSLSMTTWWASANDLERTSLMVHRGTPTHDELGQLLEDLQGSSEVPTA